MPHAFGPIAKQSLSDNLAQRIAELIHRRDLRPGDRLPSIAEMARSFGVGHPTLREGLKKLETVGAVEIRHGSGVFVGGTSRMLVVSNPLSSQGATVKLLVDLIDARIPLELRTAELAARHATEAQLARMRELLEEAGGHLDDDEVLNRSNMGFHREIALASENTVMHQILEALAKLFHDEQRAVMDIFGSRERDHREHLGILEAIAARDPVLAETRMREHLDGVRSAILQWDPERSPVASLSR